MSMTSSLIDELNKSADEWNSSNMFELARMCRRAADTISELRGALQVASVDYRHLSEENAKLRKLAKKLIILAFARCADCDLLDASCALVPTQKCLLWNYCESLARELGVEVDG